MATTGLERRIRIPGFETQAIRAQFPIDPPPEPTFEGDMNDHLPARSCRAPIGREDVLNVQFKARSCRAPIGYEAA